MGIANSVVEGFYGGEEKDKKDLVNSNKFLFLLILIKLFFIYIVMLLWPKVMPKLFPGITKNPTYINLLGLSVILALI